LDIGESNLKYKGVLVNEGLNKIDAFNPESPDNRDNSLLFLQLVKERFEKYNILFVQPAHFKAGELADFEIDIEVPKALTKKPSIKYLIRFECELLYPRSYANRKLAGYKKIFSWNDKAISDSQFVEVCIPNTMVLDIKKGVLSRTKLCCMISGNKSLIRLSLLDLYSQRVKTIRWFEQNAPQDFDLFGQGWNKPAARHGLIGRVTNRLLQYIPNLSGKVYFPSYRGKVVSKLETLQKYRFSICYENVRDLPGYITEKIFDSFFAGCIPVYWGASNISHYIPEDCFIDRRKFSNHEELYDFMVSMKESEFIAYQERIAAFLVSDRAKPFSAEAFAETIVNTIARDLGLAS
jgi:hypothetical protein